VALAEFDRPRLDALLQEVRGEKPRGGRHVERTGEVDPRPGGQGGGRPAAGEVRGPGGVFGRGPAAGGLRPPERGGAEMPRAHVLVESPVETSFRVEAEPVIPLCGGVVE
jgi:hypothetical protein